MADTTAANLLTYLSSLAENTKDTPYDINITEAASSDFGGGSASDTSIPAVIFLNKKYVNLTFADTIEKPTNTDNYFRVYLTADTANSLSLDSASEVANPYLVSVDTTIFSESTSANSMFDNCTGLTSINTSNFSNIESAQKMFYKCSSLSSIDTSHFTKVTQATAMFAYCSSLESVDTKGFTSLTENTTWMFQYCSGLKTLDAKGFTKVTLWYQTVGNCTNLKEIINFVCPIDTTQTNDYSTGTNTVYKVPLTNTINKNSTNYLVRLRTTNSNNNYTINITKRGIAEANNTSANLTFESSYPVFQTNGKLDEEIVAIEITDAQFKSKVLYRVPWEETTTA